MSPNDPLPPTLRAFAERQLGPLRRARFCGWPHAESAVWELRGSRRAFLKVFRQPRKFRQELRAYREWLLGLPKVTPKLLAVHEELYALLLSAVPGTLAERAALMPEQERELHKQAGAFLRRLHDLPFVDDDPLPLAEAFLVRTEAWSERARGLVEDDVIGWVKVQVAEAAEMLAVSKFSRVPCHRDYTPRNWLVEAQEDGIKAYVIDFEHAGPQLWFLDLRRLWGELWPTRPDLEAAFFGGYGRAMTAEEGQLLRKLSAHSAMSTVIWARAHGDRAFEAQGWAQLTWLRARQSATRPAGAAQ